MMVMEMRVSQMRETKPAEPTDFALILRPVPGDFRSPEQRLRLALKRLSRDFGLRCMSVMPEVKGERKTQ